MTKKVIRSAAPSPNALMLRVRKAIEEQGIDERSAASAIGVTPNTLEGHLRGEHVRSDSARKYENWLSGRPRDQQVFAFSTTQRPSEDLSPIAEQALPSCPERPWLVVDLFSGCGGLSLGFDLLGSGKGGRFFRTVLAIDNQAAPISVLNRNAERFGHSGFPVGQVVDLTEFANETEFLTFYLKHTAAVHEDNATAERLNKLANQAFRSFKSQIAAVDAAYLAELTTIRASDAWQRACDRLDKQALSQTSVIGFHEKLRLPRTGTRPPTLPPVLWTDGEEGPSAVAVQAPKDLMKSAGEDWDLEVSALEAKAEGVGRGQLTASARRVRSFVEFLHSPPFSQVRTAWCSWRARRATLRARLFDHEEFAQQLRKLYELTYPVSVLVGGPPCQGFSRIGRGKIRSLREASVHVHGDEEAGDARNLLFRRYVMALGALRPSAFLFENVQHFQSTVKANGVEFQATDVLAEAIANTSGPEASYAVSSRVIDASRYGVPQARQRFFMAGVLHGSEGEKQARAVAERCLTLNPSGEVPLSAALAGLPAPYFVGGELPSADAMVGEMTVSEVSSSRKPEKRFIAWIRQPLPGFEQPPSNVDSHAARASRVDDAGLFSLLGPGRRWMDYRADDAPTIQSLHQVIEALASLPPKVFNELAAAANKSGRVLPDKSELHDLLGRIDGSLPIRLLLEQIGERQKAPHHLLTSTYLAKREGNHGDWVARMDPTRPSKTVVSHMGKDTYGYVHPSASRTISVREAARVQTFPDWFSFAGTALTDAFKMVGNAVPVLLSNELAKKVAHILAERSVDSGKLLQLQSA